MYKEQQKIGMRLYKDFGNAPYYFWSVMSLIMQVTRFNIHFEIFLKVKIQAQENPELGKKMLLPLADKMCQTQVEKSGYTEGSSAELDLQLLILEGQEKWKECAAFLDRPQASVLPMAPYNLVEKGMDFLMKDKQYKRVDQLAMEAVTKMYFFQISLN